MNITFEEQQLMSIYNPGSRMGLMKALSEMRIYLDKDEQELKDLTDRRVIDFSSFFCYTDFVTEGDYAVLE